METPQPDNVDFSVPQRQSFAAIFILMLRSAVAIGKSMWPFLLVTIFKTQKEGAANKWLIIILGFVVLTIVIALLRFLFYYYYIQENHLVIKTGWLKKKTLSIPLQNIQAVHLEQNIWQQFLKVTKVSFDSAGSEKVEAQMDAIDTKKAEQLKQILLNYTAIQNPHAIDNNEETIYKLSVSDTIKLSLSANHLEAFFILLALALNLLDDVKKAFDVDGYGWMESVANSMEEHVLLAIGFAIIFVAIISIGYSIIRTMLKYYNFTLTAQHEKWRIAFGLFNRQQKLIPHNKIQLYSWHTNWLRRKINFWMLDVKTIGNDKAEVKQRQKIPLTSLSAAVTLAAAYQQSPVFNPAEGLKIEADYWKRRTLLSALPLTIILVAIGYFIIEWQSLWISLIFIYFGYRNYQWYKNYRWFANEEGIQLYSGLWGRRYMLLSWKKIQQVKLHQSPYQRKHQLATIKFITAGGHVTLPYIPLTDANALVNTVLYLVESKQENWM